MSSTDVFVESALTRGHGANETLTILQIARKSTDVVRSTVEFLKRKKKYIPTHEVECRDTKRFSILKLKIPPD